jgi:hypothetical protein
MKLLTIDQAFSSENFEETEAALFDLNAAGVYDPNFIPLLKKHVRSLDAEYNIDELMPQSAFVSKRVSFL